jgi:UDPglucose 6-dehydrogenase
MRIAVIGAGYVGLVTAAGLAHLRHSVSVGEADPARVAALDAGEVPIYEAGLPELLAAGRDAGRISYHSSNREAVADAELVFLCLPTPPDSEGRADLKYIEGVVDDLALAVGPDTVLVVKSTVPPGTTVSMRKRLADLGSPARVVAHPEFLREGTAVEDFLHPDRIVVGAFDKVDATRVASLYDSLRARVVITDPTSAEMIKYASNSYLAARLTFANALANLSEVVGADIVDVLLGVGLDHRIGPHFLKPGPGYGGSCFPKDTIALIEVARDAGYDFRLLRAVIEADEDQRQRIAAKVRNAVGGDLAGRTVALWGLAFKAGTDDVRESPATRIAHLLIDQGARVLAFDPEATAPGIESAPSPLDAVAGADALLIATEWPEFSEVDMNEVRTRMKGRAVVDARNLLDPGRVRGAGLDYYGLGRS